MEMTSVSNVATSFCNMLIVINGEPSLRQEALESFRPWIGMLVHTKIGILVGFDDGSMVLDKDGQLESFSSIEEFLEVFDPKGALGRELLKDLEGCGVFVEGGEDVGGEWSIINESK